MWATQTKSNYDLGECNLYHLFGSICSWLVVSTPLKNMKVSWDDDIPYIMESHKSHVPNHQPGNLSLITMITHHSSPLNHVKPHFEPLNHINHH